MKRSRFICILLLLCVTLSFCLASCNKDGDVSVAESSGSATQQDTEYFKDGKYVGDTLGKSYSGRTPYRAHLRCQPNTRIRNSQKHL